MPGLAPGQLDVLDKFVAETIEMCPAFPTDPWERTDATNIPSNATISTNTILVGLTSLVKTFTNTFSNTCFVVIATFPWTTILRCHASIEMTLIFINTNFLVIATFPWTAVLRCLTS